LSSAQAQLRIAGQPGPPPALARLPALRRRSRPPVPRLAGPARRGNRPGGALAPARESERAPGDRGGVTANVDRPRGARSMKQLRIGTRGSPLALWQANHVADLLRPRAAPMTVELVLIETEGDRVRDRALSQIGGDGLFTKEIQKALLDDRVDVAVH